MAAKALFALVASLAIGVDAARQMSKVDTVNRAVLRDQGWASTDNVAAQQQLTLQIALKLQNEDKLIERLLDVSSPNSKNYGKWLEKEQVDAIVQPKPEANQAVLNWLKEEGIQHVQSDGTTVTLVATVEQANRLLAADFQGYQRDGISKIRTLQYSVPLDLADHIDLIHPTTFFGKTEAYNPVHVPATPSQPAELEKRQNYQTRQPVVSPACARAISPACLKELYNVGNYTPLANSGSRVAFGSFLNETSQHQDLEIFLDYFKIPRQKVTKVFVNNATDIQDANYPSAGEANLDVQSIVGVAHPLPVFEVLTGGSPPFVPDLEMSDPSKNTNEPYLPYYQWLLAQPNRDLPQSISNSYGEPEQTVPRNYATRVCNLIAQLGARGITIFESSGDTGIGSYCKANDGSNKPRFLPQFPSTCPWITSVGGTESVNPEIAWRDSSGGFSDYFTRPAYQSRAVTQYLRRFVTPATLRYYSSFFNQRGRAFPDISAHSLLPNYQIVTGRRMGQSGGTSAASPVWAALVGLLNDARFRAGLPALGFINPWLYEDGSEFLIDITTGAARGCDGTNHQSGSRPAGAAVIPYAKWNATPGWDPATGLGIPDFQKMLTNVLDNGEEDSGPWWLRGWGRSRVQKPKPISKEEEAELLRN